MSFATTTYGLSIPATTPTGDAGLALSDNLTTIDNQFATIDDGLAELQQQTNDKADAADLAIVDSSVATHVADQSNPHAVTKAQVGLGNVVDALQLQAASNLVDLPDKSAARVALGLGSAATAPGTAFAPASHTHDGSAIVTGTVPAARLGSGTPAAGNVLIGTGAWTASPSLSGTISAAGFSTSGGVTASGTIAAGTLQQGANTLNTILSSYVLTSTATTTYTPQTRTLSTTAPLTGGGSLAGNLTLSIDPASGSAAGSMSSSHYALLAAATDANTASTIVKRDAAGNVALGSVTLPGTDAFGASNMVLGYTVSGNTSKTTFTQTTPGNNGQRSNEYTFTGENTFLNVINVNDGVGIRFGWGWYAGRLGYGYPNGNYGWMFALDGTNVGTIVPQVNSIGPVQYRTLIDDGSGRVAINYASAPTAFLDVNGDTIRQRVSKTPATSAASGNQGDHCWDANYLYVCTATNTWKRAALSTW